jgi:hypothetical protein
MRSQDTIKRLKMYNNGKAIRNAEGTVVGGQFMMKDRAGDVKITASTGRVAPDRRWFGNTRVVGATELDKFREEMTTSAADPYSVVVARKKLPMGLLMDSDTSKNAAKAAKEGLLMNESFEQAFTGKVGGGARKRVKVDQLLIGREAQTKRKKTGANAAEGEATVVDNPYGDDADPYSALLKVRTGIKSLFESNQGGGEERKMNEERKNESPLTQPPFTHPNNAPTPSATRFARRPSSLRSQRPRIRPTRRSTTRRAWSLGVGIPTLRRHQERALIGCTRRATTSSSRASLAVSGLSCTRSLTVLTSSFTSLTLVTFLEPSAR